MIFEVFEMLKKVEVKLDKLEEKLDLLKQQLDEALPSGVLHSLDIWNKEQEDFKKIRDLEKKYPKRQGDH